MRRLVPLTLSCLVLAGCGDFTTTQYSAANYSGGYIFKIGPVLQDAKPHAITIMWETDLPGVSYIEWGPTSELGRRVNAEHGPDDFYQVKTARIDHLSPDTVYYYRAVTAGREGRIFSFRTPPEAGDVKTFKFAAYSDCQQRPAVHQNIVDQGIHASIPGDVIDELGFVLVAGDIVQNGVIRSEYRERFLEPIKGLSPYVPYYVAIGNHERDHKNYFNYLSLPRNGTPGFEEHWYSIQYGNALVIALDTNDAYQNQIQLEWLDSELEEACTSDTTDFVFAFFHHPWKSELWVDGETRYSGEIVQRLEQTLTSCNKKGAYFFGHTHGYSRGQSRDAPLYWVNVGSAGGGLDYWGEFRQHDLPEFQKSFDEYGVVMVEVNPDGERGFQVQRLTFGDDRGWHGPAVQDEFGTFVDYQRPERPVVTSVEGGVLSATEFSDDNGHLESHWELLDQNMQPLWSSWDRFENWYNEVDTNAGIDLTTADATSAADRAAYARVRYRDMELNWSAWSRPMSLR